MMNERKRRFVQAYLLDPNATRAAKAVGYSEKTSVAQGSRLLRDVDVSRLIEMGRKRLATRYQVTTERVIAEYAKIAFSDMRDFAAWGSTGVSLLDSAALTPEQAAAVAEVGETRGTDKGGGALRFKLHDKKGALDSLAKHLGLFKDESALDPYEAARTIAAAVRAIDEQDSDASMGAVEAARGSAVVSAVAGQI